MFYHVQTYSDFINLMDWLHKKGYRWTSGVLPLINMAYWYEHKEDTLIYLNSKRISKGNIHDIPEILKHIPIYNAKEIKYIN